MADPPARPDRFSTAALVWQAWPAAGLPPPAEADTAPAALPPFIPALIAPPREAAALRSALPALFRRKGAGLSLGEREFVSAAVSRRIGCFHSAASHARRAANALRRRREVDLLLEEGLPSPLGGRLGAGIAAAAALASVPPAPPRRAIWRLEEEKLDDQEIVDLILIAGYAAWNARLSLALGESRKAPQ